MHTLYLKINVFTRQIICSSSLFFLFFFSVLIIVCTQPEHSIQCFFEQIQMVFECTSLFEQNPRMCFEKVTPYNLLIFLGVADTVDGSQIVKSAVVRIAHRVNTFAL